MLIILELSLVVFASFNRGWGAIPWIIMFCLFLIGYSVGQSGALTVEIARGLVFLDIAFLGSLIFMIAKPRKDKDTAEKTETISS